MEDYPKLRLRSGLPSTTFSWTLSAEKNMNSTTRGKITSSRYISVNLAEKIHERGFAGSDSPSRPHAEVAGGTVDDECSNPPHDQPLRSGASADHRDPNLQQQRLEVVFRRTPFATVSEYGRKRETADAETG